MVKVDVIINVQNIVAIVFAILGCGLLIASFIVAPCGEIASSVEWVVGEIMCFIASLLGVDSYYRSKTKPSNQSTQPTNQENQQQIIQDK